MCGLVVLEGVASKDMVKLLKESEAKGKIENEDSNPTVTIQQESSLQAGQEGQIVVESQNSSESKFLSIFVFGVSIKSNPKKVGPKEKVSS